MFYARVMAAPRIPNPRPSSGRPVGRSGALVAFAALLLASSCGPSAPPATPPNPANPQAHPPLTADDLLSDADARVFSPRLARAHKSPDPHLRLTAYVALARQHDAGHALLLRDGLRDSSSGVRSWAALGLGALGHDAPEDAERWLLLALAAESDPAVRASLTEALGRVGSDLSDGALRAELTAEAVEERVSACRALANLGRRDVSPSAASTTALLSTLANHPGPDVVVACTEALGRLPRAAAPGFTDRITEALTTQAVSPTADARRLAFRGLGRRGAGEVALLVGGAEDPDWQVAVAALGALGRRTEPAAKAACGELLSGVGTTNWESANGTRVHRVRALVAACSAWARDEPVYRPASDALRSVASVPASNASDWRGQVHCALASLVDRGRGWPNESPRCGLGRVPGDQRLRQAAEVVGDVPGADAERGAYLERISAGASARVREAVLSAAAHVNAPNASQLLLAGLADPDRGVVDTSLEVLVDRAQAWARGGEGDAGMARIDSSALLPAMRHAFETLHAADDLEGLGLYVDALGRLPLTELDPSLDTLARHWNVAVREKALAVLRTLGRALPEGEPAQVPDAQRVHVWADQAMPEVLVRTNRGEFLLELRPDAAPETTARFLELVDAGFYAGLTFHRVVPGFVVQGGDPRGDGYGGPSFSQRCEDNPLRYERGSVGMALAGRDTGGSQFFITYGAEPSLDGGYTLFGRVARGMEVVDQLQEGDRMIEVRRPH